MREYYPYLVASLPMLHYLMRPPFSFEEFLGTCCRYIPDHDCQILRSFPHPDQYGEKQKYHPIIQKWIGFETDLRNELVRTRAAKKDLKPESFFRTGGEGDSSQTSLILAALNNSSLLDVERALDEIRWKALEELSTGHYLDLGFLITYAGKLQILERWERIQREDGNLMLKKAIDTARSYS